MRIIRPDILAVFRAAQRCAHCGRPTPDGCDPHHYWIKRGMGGGTRIDHPWNLISLCRGWRGGKYVSCHDDAGDAGLILKETLLAKVAARVGVQQQQIVNELERILKLPKGSKVEVPAP